MAANLLPLFDLTRQWADLREEATTAFERVAASGAFSLGEDLRLFEAEFADYCGTHHCVGVANGTVAIELALRALGVGPGEEVIAPANTFVATVEAIAATGARPVLVDMHPRTRAIDPETVKSAVNARTAAIVPVHLYGRPAPVPDMDAFFSDHRLSLVEDAAQAHGATLDGRRIGSLGSAGCFSFYPTKNLGAMGDGGAVVTDDDSVADIVRSLRHHGASPHDANRHDRPGRTERLDNLQAAILRLKLRRLDSDNDCRRRIADRYRRRLANLPLDLPPLEVDNGRSVYHLFVVEVDDRDRVRSALATSGIGTGVHYPTPIHLQPAWRHLGYGAGDFPASERAASRVLSLPMFPGMDEADVDRVGRALEQALSV